jgi:hypothetical protein
MCDLIKQLFLVLPGVHILKEFSFCHGVVATFTFHEALDMLVAWGGGGDVPFFLTVWYGLSSLAFPKSNSSEPWIKSSHVLSLSP